MTRFISNINGNGGARMLNLEILIAESQGFYLHEIFVVPAARPDERFGDNGAYLIFKPTAPAETNAAPKG